MKYLAALASVCLIFSISPGCSASTPPEDLVAFVNVNVVPMDAERILSDYTVVVAGTRIVSLGPAATTPIPTGARKVDGTGKYLMPGLAEMHGHIPSVNAESDKKYAEEVLFLYVAGGVTTVRGMLGGPGHLALRERAARREIVSPTLYLAGPALTGNSVNSVEQAREKVRSIKNEGWDLIKVHEGLTAEEYDAAVTTAHEVGIRFGGHVTNAVALDHAMAMGQETFDHMDGYLDFVYGDGDSIDDERLAKIVDLSRQSRSWVVPTLSLLASLWAVAPLDQLESYPELAYVSRSQAADWSSRYAGTVGGPDWSHDQFVSLHQDHRRILKALSDAGAGVLLGSDAPQLFSVPGFSLQHEMEIMQEAGLTPFEVYTAGTRSAGEYFQRHDSFGTIAVGRRADLVLLDKNPLEDVAHFATRAGVMVRGRWFPQAEIQTRLDAIAASYE